MAVRDWDKPVVWHFLPGNELCPVVFSKIVDGDEVRWAVVERGGRLEAIPVHGRWAEDFWNLEDLSDE